MDLRDEYSIYIHTMSWLICGFSLVDLVLIVSGSFRLHHSMIIQITSHHRDYLIARLLHI